MLARLKGLRVALHADRELDILVESANTKGVMPCNEPG
jgi:hypothetical protein